MVTAKCHCRNAPKRETGSNNPGIGSSDAVCTRHNSVCATGVCYGEANLHDHGERAFCPPCFSAGSDDGRVAWEIKML